MKRHQAYICNDLYGYLTHSYSDTPLWRESSGRGYMDDENAKIKFKIAPLIRSRVSQHDVLG